MLAPGHDRAHRRDRRGEDPSRRRHRAARRRSRRERRRAARRGGRLDRGALRRSTTPRWCRAESSLATDGHRAYRQRPARDGRAARRGRHAPRRPARTARHQSLLGVAEQRSALDQFGGVDLGPLRACAGARPRSSMPSSPLSVATSERGPGRSTCCATKSTSSTARTWMIPRRIAGSRPKRIGWRTRRPTAMPALAPSMPSPVTGEHSTRWGSRGAGLAGRAPFAELEARLHALEAEAADIGAELRHLGDGSPTIPSAWRRYGLAASC